MNLESFIKANDQSINGFANEHNIPVATAWRAASGRTLRPNNALRISKATGGKVTVMELLFPAKKQKRERQPKS